MNKLINKILFVFICFFTLFNEVFSYNKAVVDITTMDIFEIQDAIDNGYLTYELLAKLYLDRIESYDDEFNCLITINKNIIDEARKKDLEYKKNGRNSILFGIPILVKDNIDVEGFPTTNGTISLADNYPNDDAYIIKKLKEKGALIIGKTNMSEFAFYSSSSISSYGAVKNAYDTYYSSYGSSGGTAVGVSLQFATLGIGTDTNSSLRVPASCNNVIGFRPTIDLLSNDGIINYDITRDTAGAITKTAKENAVLMAIMEGKEEDYYLKNIDKLNLRTIKVGVIKDFLYGNDSGLEGTGKTYTEIENLMKDTLNILEQNGVEIVEIDSFYKKEYDDIRTSTQGGWTMCHAFNNYIKNSSSKINNFYELAISSGHITSLWGYVSDCFIDIEKIDDYDKIKKPYEYYINDIMNKNELDFLIYPATKNRVLKVNENSDNFHMASHLISPVIGYPAVSVSIGKDVDGLYYGMEVVAKENEEEKLYQFINEYEKINNKYSLSTLAPPLYEIPNNVKKLVVLYGDNKTKKIIIKNNADDYRTFKKINEQVEQFIFNYNDFNKTQEEIDNLLLEYEQATLKLNSLINIEILTIVVPLIILSILIIKFLQKRKRNVY